MHLRNSGTRSMSSCCIRHVPSAASGFRGVNALIFFLISKFHETSVTRSFMCGKARIGSTVIGQGLDSIIFYPLAFAGLWTGATLLKVMAANWAFKVLVEVVMTPVTYVVCERLKRAEGVDADPEALAMIAAAAEGSVRDGLSILDQAISHADLVGSEDGKTRVTAEQVRQMLGLADKTMQRRLLDAVLSGKGGTVLEEVAQQYALGIEPIAMMRAQMDVVHRVTVTQIGGVGPDIRSTEEREALEGWAKALSAGLRLSTVTWECSALTRPTWVCPWWVNVAMRMGFLVR